LNEIDLIDKEALFHGFSKKIIYATEGLRRAKLPS